MQPNTDMRNLAEPALSCGDEAAITTLGLPGLSANQRDLRASPETRSLEPYMTTQGIETIIKDVERVARTAIQRRYPGMQASDVDDLTQNALLRIVKKIDTFDRSRPAAPWISVVATREAAECFRAKSGSVDTQRTTLSDPHSLAQLNLPSREPRVDSVLIAEEERHLTCLAVRKFWDALGEADIKKSGFREIFLLEALGYQVKQVARIIDVKETTAIGRHNQLPHAIRRAIARMNSGAE